MVRVQRLAQIETDGVVRLHAELLDWRVGLKSALNDSVGDSYDFVGYLFGTDSPASGGLHEHHC